jgi:hypothetical protein
MLQPLIVLRGQRSGKVLVGGRDIFPHQESRPEAVPVLRCQVAEDTA